MRGLRSDKRGQSLQVGAVLLLGILVLSLTVFQTSVVPQENKEVEFASYLDSSADMERVHNDVLSAGQQGIETGTTVETGTTYPRRTLLINPSPATGSIRTTEKRNVTISGVKAVDGEEANVQAFWNDSETYNITTKKIRFEPSYNNFDGDPVVVTSTSAYREADSGTIGLTGQSLSDNGRISILAIRGNVSTSGLSVSLNMLPRSAAKRTVTVTGDGGTDFNISLPFASETQAEQWNKSSVAKNLRANDNYVKGTQVDANSPYGTVVNVTLNGSKEHELVLGVVEAKTANSASQVSEPNPEYVIPTTGNNTAMSKNQSQRLVVEVRDRYNNPVDGVEVTFSTADGKLNSKTSDVTVKTSSEGRASVVFNPTNTGNLSVDATFGRNTNYNETTFDLSVSSSSSTGTSTSSDPNGTTDGTFGTSGTEDWSSSDSEKSISSAGGYWRNLSGVNQLLLQNPTFAPTEAQGSKPSSDRRYFRISFAITNGTRTYYITMTESSKGLSYQLGNNNPWGNSKLHLMKEDSGSVEWTSKIALNTSALDLWWDPSSSSSEPLKIREPGAYASDSSSQGRERLTEIKQFLRNNNDVDVFTAELHGRVNLNATAVGQTLAYPDEFNDGDDGGGNAENQENNSLAPSPSVKHKMDGFSNLQQPANAATIDDKDDEGGNMTTTATYGVNQNASTYTLELGYSFQEGTESDVNISIVRANGTVLQTEQLSSTITLNTAATDYVQSTGNLYVVWQKNGGGPKVKIDIDYQRVRAS